jgi:uncharacterized repeat protein (TIGR01451 family)
VTDVGGDGSGGSVDAVGDVITYQILITNDGDTDLTNILAGDPKLLDFSCDQTVPGATLAPAEVLTCTGSYTSTQADDLDGDGTVNNQSFADSDETGLINSSAIVPVTQTTAMTIEKIVTDVGGDGADGSVDAVGDTIEYEITVTNTGNTNLSTVDVTDDLVASLSCTPTVPDATVTPGFKIV